METLRRDNPFVYVYAANEDTIVHICKSICASDGDQFSAKESHNEVVMTLMQFRSLMFHLQALDAQFMQGSEKRSVHAKMNRNTLVRNKLQLKSKMLMMVM